MIAIVTGKAPRFCFMESFFWWFLWWTCNLEYEYDARLAFELSEAEKGGRKREPRIVSSRLKQNKVFGKAVTSNILCGVRRTWDVRHRGWLYRIRVSLMQAEDIASPEEDFRMGGTIFKTPCKFRRIQSHRFRASIIRDSIQISYVAKPRRY